LRVRDLLFGAPIRWIRGIFRRPAHNGSAYYCVEFVAQCLKPIGRFHGRPDRHNPKSFAKYLEKTGKCGPPQEIRL
jgi:hypothetical protein